MRALIVTKKILNVLYLAYQIGIALAIKDGDDDTELDQFSTQLGAKANGLPGRRRGSGTR